MHGEAQLAERWGEHGRQIVLDTSSVKVFLPGITDTTTLQAAATLCGQASWKIRGPDHATRHDVASPDMIRQLPAGFALVIRGGCAPVITRLPRAWRNPAYRRARHGAQFPAEPARRVPPPGWTEPLVPDHVPAGLPPRHHQLSLLPLELTMTPESFTALIDEMATCREQLTLLDRREGEHYTAITARLTELVGRIAHLTPAPAAATPAGYQPGPAPPGGSSAPKTGTSR